MPPPLRPPALLAQAAPARGVAAHVAAVVARHRAPGTAQPRAAVLPGGSVAAHVAAAVSQGRGGAAPLQAKAAPAGAASPGAAKRLAPHVEAAQRRPAPAASLAPAPRSLAPHVAAALAQHRAAPGQPAIQRRALPGLRTALPSRVAQRSSKEGSSSISSGFTVSQIDLDDLETWTVASTRYLGMENWNEAYWSWGTISTDQMSPCVTFGFTAFYKGRRVNGMQHCMPPVRDIKKLVLQITKPVNAGDFPPFGELENVQFFLYGGSSEFATFGGMIRVVIYQMGWRLVKEDLTISKQEASLVKGVVLTGQGELLLSAYDQIAFDKLPQEQKILRKFLLGMATSLIQFKKALSGLAQSNASYYQSAKKVLTYRLARILDLLEALRNQGFSEKLESDALEMHEDIAWVIKTLREEVENLGTQPRTATELEKTLF